MALISAHQMSSKQIEDLDALVTRCQTSDLNTIPIYKHMIDKFHTLPCNLLFYNDNKLIGFLRSFFFYPNACEMAVMVDPEFRRKGIARTMLNTIIPLLQIEQIRVLYFSTPHGHNIGWFTQLGFSFRNSERQMQYNPNKTITVTFNPTTIRMAGLSDIPALIELDEVCFPNKKPDAKEVFINLMTTSNCSIFISVLDQRIVGKAHVFKESDRARITDIGVNPAYRGQGLASSLIKCCINHALVNNKPKIVLDVEITNETALKLYHALGFEIINAHDYWGTPEDALEFGLASILQPSDVNYVHVNTIKS